MVLKIEPVNESVWHLIPGFGQLLINFGQLWVVLSDLISSWFPIEQIGPTDPVFKTLIYTMGIFFKGGAHL